MVEKETRDSEIFSEMCCYTDEQIQKYLQPGLRLPLPCNGCMWQEVPLEVAGYSEGCFCEELVELGNCPICKCYGSYCNHAE